MQTKKADTENELPNNQFSQLIVELNNGAFLHEASTDLQKVVHAVQQTGKTGELIVKIKVIPNGNAVSIFADSTPKAPKMKSDATVMFIGDNATLQRDNPHQRKLDFTSVQSPVVPMAPIADAHKEQKEVRDVVNG